MTNVAALCNMTLLSDFLLAQNKLCCSTYTGIIT